MPHHSLGLVGLGLLRVGVRLAFSRGWGDQEVMLPHQAPNAFLVDRLLLHKAQVGPDTPIAPEGMLRFQRPDTLQQAFIALGRPGARAAGSSQHLVAFF